MRILFLVIGIPLVAWVIISPAVVVWWFFKWHNRDRFAKAHEKIFGAVYIGAFFCLLFVFNGGIKELFFFIPADWGADGEDGDFVTTRSSIAGTLAFVMSCFFVEVFMRVDRLRDENRRLKKTGEIERRKGALRHYDLDSLIQERERVESTLDGLRENYDTSATWSDDKLEIEILVEMQDELYRRIRANGRQD